MGRACVEAIFEPLRSRTDLAYSRYSINIGRKYRSDI